MTERVRAKKPSAKKTAAPVEKVQTAADKLEHEEKVKADAEAMLDEIDAVLEENAEEFVRQYVQKGGQ